MKEIGHLAPSLLGSKEDSESVFLSSQRCRARDREIQRGREREDSQKDREGEG